MTWAWWLAGYFVIAIAVLGDRLRRVRLLNGRMLAVQALIAALWPLALVVFSALAGREAGIRAGARVRAFRRRRDRA